MDDDLNTPGALAVLAELAHEVFLHKQDTARAAALGAELRQLAGILGVLQQDPEVFLQAGIEQVPEGEETEGGALTAAMIQDFIQRRTEARRTKNWAEADHIRKTLAEQGVILEDLPDGTTTWRRE